MSMSVGSRLWLGLAVVVWLSVFLVAGSAREAFGAVAAGACQRSAASGSALRFNRLDTFYGEQVVGDAVYAVGRFGLIVCSPISSKLIWRKIPSGTEDSLLDVDFVDRREGWVVGDAGTILHTEDGGETWKPQRSGVSVALMSVKFLDQNNGFAVGEFGTLLKTTNGGHTWQDAAPDWSRLLTGRGFANGIALSQIQPQLYRVYFVNRTQGWITGEFGLVLHTADAGQSWAVQNVGGDLGGVYAVLFLTSRDGWAVGQAGYVLHTLDGGKSWVRVVVLTAQDLYCLVRGSAPHEDELVVGGAGSCLLTLDGGAHWHDVTSAIMSVVGRRSIIAMLGMRDSRFLIGGTLGLLDEGQIH
jgi:photosystem II stability/assembly factor-like uncharacterized protein